MLRRLVLRSFPRLRRLPVEIGWGEEEDLLSYRVRAGRHSILVNECLRGAPARVLEGGIVHELCHLEGDLLLGPASRRQSWDRYFHSRWARMREERAVERRAVALGYAQQLLAFQKFAHRLGWSFGREHGLLYVELTRALVAKNAQPKRSAGSPGRLLPACSFS